MKNLNLKLAVVAACLVGISACTYIGGKKVSVDFRDAEGLRGGEAVYVAGVKIGRVSDEPSLVNGRARVPVQLSRRNKDGVPAGSVFLLKADPNDPRKQCLVAYSLGSGAPAREGPEPIYVGVSNRAELLLMLGAEKANKFWGEMTK